MRMEGLCWFFWRATSQNSHPDLTQSWSSRTTPCDCLELEKFMQCQIIFFIFLTRDEYWQAKTENRETKGNNWKTTQLMLRTRKSQLLPMGHNLVSGVISKRWVFGNPKSNWKLSSLHRTPIAGHFPFKAHWVPFLPYRPEHHQKCQSPLLLPSRSLSWSLPSLEELLEGLGEDPTTIKPPHHRSPNWLSRFAIQHEVVHWFLIN